MIYKTGFSFLSKAKEKQTVMIDKRRKDRLKVLIISLL